MTQTHLNAADDALRRSEVRYRRLFQTAKDGILIVDARTGTIIEANQFMAELLGRDVAELTGKELWEIGLFGDIAANKEAFKELQQRGYLRYDHLPVVDRDGRTVEVEVISNVYDEGGRLVAQCNVRDIAERSRLEREIRKQTDTLAEEHRFKDEFLAMLSHELRNPLAPILSATQLLGRDDDPEIQKEARAIIERQVRNLARLTGDLLEVSRVINGRFRLRREDLELAQVVTHAVASTRTLLQARGHVLEVSMPDEPLLVRGDTTRLEEVVVNLLNNAAKYTRDGGLVEVVATKEDGHAVLRVRDNGIGIEAGLLPRVFDIFSQGQRGLDRAEGGLGIGLCLVQRLVELHGGDVEAHSAGLGKGSEFVVRLPLAAPSDGVPAASDPERDDGRLRVLVVDDNHDACLSLAHLLRRSGYGVQTSFTSASALRTVQAWRPQVILLDIGLPEIDGYELARRIRRDYAREGMHLVAVTGYGSVRDVRLAKEAGFEAHLLKPVDFVVLDALLASLRSTSPVR
jgi:PAS domain S-box-containing protein